MTRPSVVRQVIGTPVIAAALCAIYAAVLWGWYIDRIPFIFALAAAFAAKFTASAFDTVRRYKDWQANVRMMTGDGDSLFTRSNRAKRQQAAACGIAAILAWAAQPPADFLVDGATETVRTGIWAVLIAAWVYVAWDLFARLIVSIRRLIAKSRRKHQEKDAIEPVSWTLRRATNSPSRADGMANLPEYCTVLFKGVATPPEFTHVGGLPPASQ